MEFLHRTWFLILYSSWLLLPLIRPALEFIISTEMAARSVSVEEAGGKLSRDDPQYVRFLEDQLERANERYERSEGNINHIMSRLERLEISGRRPRSNPFSLDTDEKLNFTPRQAGHAPTLTPHPRPTWDLPTPSWRHQGGGGLGPVPAEIYGAPLTQALTDLTEAINPGPADYKKGINFRPEYYVQHKIDCKPVKSLDHSKMSYKDLMYGMTQVLQYFVKAKGDVEGYANHFAFVAKQGQLNQFSDAALVAYDRAVVDKIVRGDLFSFGSVDTMAAACSFHAGNVLGSSQVKRDQGQSRRGRGFFNRNRSRVDTSGGHTGESADRDTGPQDPFPQDLCYNFNYRKCFGGCGKSHICRVCRGKHRGLGCMEKA